MPPRKEPKEQVVYPASKRKVPAFKPLRPSTLPRVESTGSESAAKPKPAPKKAAARPAAKRKSTVSDNEDNIEDDDGSSSDLADPKELAFQPASKLGTKAGPGKKQKTREASPAISITSTHDKEPPDDNPETSFIPQPLLLRLLHQSFTDKNTKIDKHAIQVFQQYIEIFVRETIARCKADKEAAAERGEVGEADKNWLELEDLEKVAPGMMLDF